MGNIIKLDEFREKKEEINFLKNKLAELIGIYDELRFVICKNIESSYMVEIGYFEFKAYDYFYKYLRLKRKKSLIQAKINRKEEIFLDEIDHKLDLDFESFKENLEEEYQKLQDAYEYTSGDFLTVDESLEIKKLYRKLVKKLHPDLNPRQNLEDLDLFNNLTQAYKKGDLPSIRIIDMIVEKSSDTYKENYTKEDFDFEIEKFKNSINHIKDEIKKIKTSPPYTLKVFLDDEKKKNEKIEEIKKKIKAYKDRIDSLKDDISHLLGA